MFESIETIKRNGFEGFVSVKNLCNNRSCIPKKMGVYLVILPEEFKIEFSQENLSGYRGGRNPTVPISILEHKWVSDTVVLYIGKAGDPVKKSHLEGRINCYLKHGNGDENAAHWGGRMIWQLKNSENLLFCWKPSENPTPRQTEKKMIQTFYDIHRKLPFANLRG